MTSIDREMASFEKEDMLTRSGPRVTKDECSSLKDQLQSWLASGNLVLGKLSSFPALSVSHSDSLQPAWAVAHQTPLSMEFSRQEYWSGYPFHSPGDLSDPGIEPESLALQADSLPPEPPGKLSALRRVVHGAYIV